MRDEIRICSDSDGITAEEATQIVAGIWCKGKNRNKVMDADLAMEFVAVLQREVNHRVAMLKVKTKGSRSIPFKPEQIVNLNWAPWSSMLR
jgi:hypothetical protein